MLVRWNDRAMPRRRRQATDRRVMSCRDSEPFPRSGGGGQTASSRVDFPAPFGPMTP